MLFDENLARSTLYEPSEGPATGLAENVISSFRSQAATDLSTSTYDMIKEEEDEQRKKIEEISGLPFEETIAPFMSGGGVVTTRNVLARYTPTGRILDQAASWASGSSFTDEQEKAIQSFKQTLGAKEAAFILTPEERRVRAKERAIERVRENERVASKATFWGGVGQFGGALGAQATDPINIASMAVGPAAGASLKAAVAINAAVGAGATALQQPFVQAQKKELSEFDEAQGGPGIPYGLGDAAMNIGLGGAAGGGITAGIGLAGKGIKALVKSGRATPEDIMNLSQRDIVELFDETVKNPTPSEQAARVRLEAEAVIEERNPFTPVDDTPEADMEIQARHQQRIAEVEDAIQNDRPLPRYEEDIANALEPEEVSKFVDTMEDPLRRIRDLEQELDAVPEDMLPKQIRNDLAMAEVEAVTAMKKLVKENPKYGVKPKDIKSIEDVRRVIDDAKVTGDQSKLKVTPREDLQDVYDLELSVEDPAYQALSQMADEAPDAEVFLLDDDGNVSVSGARKLKEQLDNDDKFLKELNECR